MTTPPDEACPPGAHAHDAAASCVTCGDVAVEMRVVSLDSERELALCETAEGLRASVETALVSPVSPDDALLVHAGTAIARLGPA